MSLIPVDGTNPWSAAFKALWEVAHNDDGTQKSGAMFVLASTASAGATTFTTSTPLPPWANTQSGQAFVIGGYTTGAEIRFCSPTTGSTYQFSPALANTHAAGSVVIPILDAVYAEWMGVFKGFSNAGYIGQAANINWAIGQLGNVFGLGDAHVKFVFGPGPWIIDDQIETGGCFVDLAGANIICASDFGAGKYAIDASGGSAAVSQIPQLTGGTVSGPLTPKINNAGVDMVVTNGSSTVTSATGNFASASDIGKPLTISGVVYTILSVVSATTVVLTAPYSGTPGTGRTWSIDRNPSTSMDGVKIDSGVWLRGLHINGFRKGIRCFGFNHATLERILINNCWDGIYVDPTADSAGDDRFFFVQIEQCMHAAVAGYTNALSASDWHDGHFYGCPVGFFSEQGPIGPLFYRFSFENIGNAIFYFGSTATATMLAYQCFDGSTGPSGSFFSTFQDPTLKVGVHVNDAAQYMSFSFSGFTPWFSNPSTSTLVPGFVGSWVPATSRMDLTNQFPWSWTSPAFGGQGVGDGRDHVYENVQWYCGAFSGILASVNPNSTVKAGDLLELNAGGGAGVLPRLQQYQTSGAAPYAVALENDNGIQYAMWMVVTGGEVTLNMDTGNSMTRYSYVKPDPSHAGRVVQASGFSDGPVVGVAVAANNTSSTGYGSTNTVLVKLMI